MLINSAKSCLQVGFDWEGLPLPHASPLPQRIPLHPCSKVRKGCVGLYRVVHILYYDVQYSQSCSWALNEENVLHLVNCITHQKRHKPLTRWTMPIWRRGSLLRSKACQGVLIGSQCQSRANASNLTNCVAVATQSLLLTLILPHPLSKVASSLSYPGHSGSKSAWLWPSRSYPLLLLSALPFCCI